MARWSLFEYGLSVKAKVITNWRIDLSVQAKADMDVFLSDLVKSERWKPPKIDSLRGDKGLLELRWKSSEGVQHRIFGEYDGEKKFSMYVGCTHKGKVYKPSDPFKLARERRRDRNNGIGGMYAYEID